MSDYGRLQEIAVVPRTTGLTTAASISDTELVVDSAGDFDPDGGTLELNGAQLDYTAIVWGDTEDDSDTIVLTAPLAVAADVDDEVAPVSGGLAVEDWWAVVDMGDGDAVMVPLTYPQRFVWAPGQYDPAVKVEVSEDLQRLEDAPGRAPASSASGRVKFINTDTATAAGPGEMNVPLTYLPIDGSEHVYWNTLLQPPTEWTRDGKVITLADADSRIEAGDVISVAYAYDGAGAQIERPPLPGVLDLDLVGTATFYSDQTSLALPGVTQEGDLIVLVTTTAGAASEADPRLTEAFVVGDGAFVAWGYEDGSGDPLAVSIDGGSPDKAATIVAVYRGVVATTYDTDTNATLSISMPVLADAQGALGIIIAATNADSGSLGTDSTLEWTHDSTAEDGRVHSSINHWSDADLQPTPAGLFTMSGTPFVMYAVTLLLEAA